MEFRVTNRYTGAKQAVSSAKGEKSGQSARLSLKKPMQADRLALSQRAVNMLEEWTRQEAQERAKRQKDRMAGKEEASGSPLDAAVKTLKAMQQCQKIAARIRAGDKVPPEDEKFLQENDPAGYQLAIASRKPKKDPKEWDSVLEDEKKDASGTQGVSETGASGSGGGAAVEASEAPAEG